VGTPKKWAAHGLVSVLNLLRHGKAVETENTDALYGLIVIGQLLKARGDTEAAQALPPLGAEK
jgi:hypothetical protein